MYDSNVYALEFQPGIPIFVTVEESLTTVFSLVEASVNVPCPNVPSLPSLPVSPFSPCSP